MNTDLRSPQDPLARLIRAARENSEDDSETTRLEFGFETRVLARIREERGTSWLAWAAKLCPFAAALALLAGAWSYAHWDDSPDGESVVDAVRLAGVPVLDYYLGGEQ